MVREFAVLGSGLACIALVGAGVGVGLVFSALINGTARNFNKSKALFNHAILGFALSEATRIIWIGGSVYFNICYSLVKTLWRLL